MARETGLEPATSTVTGWHSNQLSYSPAPYLYQPLTITVNVYIKYTILVKMQVDFAKKAKKFAKKEFSDVKNFS